MVYNTLQGNLWGIMLFDIGDTVQYIRHNKDGINQGEAVLKGIGLDADGRKIVLLKDAEGNAFNAYYAAVNPTEEFIADFQAQMTEIESVSKEGNAKAKAVVDEYNARVSKIYDALVGESVEM